MAEHEHEPLLHVMEAEDAAFALSMDRNGRVQFFGTIPKMDVVACLRRIADSMEAGQGDTTIAGGHR